MKKLLCFLVLFGSCMVCEAKQPLDTIDNWQIYLDDSLLFAGNQTMSFLPEIIISKIKVNPHSVLKIVYNCDYTKTSKKEIQIADSSGRRLTQRYFKWNKPIRIKVTDLLSFSRNAIYTLYFYDGYLTVPAGIRGIALIKIKFA